MRDSAGNTEREVGNSGQRLRGDVEAEATISPRTSRLNAGGTRRGHRAGVKLAAFAALCGCMLSAAIHNAAAANTHRAQQEYLERIATGDTFNYILVSRKGDKIIAKDADSGKILRDSAHAREIIEWALTMADVTVLQKGRYELPGTLEIPRSGVSLIVGQDAVVVAAPDADLTVLSEGHANFPSLIRVKNRNDVAVINLGTLDAGGEIVDGPDIRAKNGWPSCVTFDGRNGGTCGINGGLVFSTGTVNGHDAFWMVDSANLRIPLIWRSSMGNVPLAMEGCEDCRLGIIAGLQEKANENETLDFNSYNQRIEVDTVLAWVPGGTKDEILDVNNSPDCTIGRVIGYGPMERTRLVNMHKYGTQGRRLTQKRHIDNNSNGTVVKEEKLVEKKVKAWKRTVETPGFPESLPLMKIKAGLTAVFEDDCEEQVFENSYKFNLARSGEQ